MKHGGFKAVYLTLLAFAVLLPTFADEKTLSLESRVLESFNGDSGYVWKAVASKFATRDGDNVFPKVSYVNVWPLSLHGSKPENAEELKAFGIWCRFDRKGYNWIDLYPVEEGAAEDANPAEIPIPGRAKMLDLWVWGSNYNYYLEAYIRDFKGVVHVLQLGDLHYEGWKNLRTNIPENIPQSKRELPKRQGLTLVKFRVWTRPMERVDDFRIYFDQVKILTDLFESLFDGDELTDPDYVDEVWGAE